MYSVRHEPSLESRIKIDSPHVLGKFRQLNVSQRLMLARLKGLRASLLQTDRKTAAGVATLIDELYAMLGAAVVRETERRKVAIVLEASRETDVGKDWVLSHRPRPGADQAARRIARRIDISGRRFLPSVQTGRNESYPRSQG